MTHPIVPAKPLLRGWLHLAMIPITLVGGIVLLMLARSSAAVIGAGVWLAASLMLFGVSALYHRRTWGTKGVAVLRRLDHANIFLFIAATYTPLSLLLLDKASSTLLLSLIWSVAAAGVIFKLVWLSAPRWLYTVLYLVMGWTALGWLVQFWFSGGPLIVALIALGGILYSIGAVVYALKRPNPWPRVFGFHEIFHLCTVLAAASHYAAIVLTFLR